VLKLVLIKGETTQ